jgi:hypothetical protein
MTLSGTARSSQGTVSSSDASRRTFLKGAGLAGAASLAAPLLTSTSARAANEGIILGCNADTYPAFTAAVPGATGCRSYRDVLLSSAADVDKYLTKFPGLPGSNVVVSIHPDPTVLLDPKNCDQPGLEQALKTFIESGRDNPQLPEPQLTVWHEAGNLYKDLSYITPTSVRQMHAKMQSLCTQVTGVRYGCIIYGDIAAMDQWIPNAPYALDWYGVDVYWDGNFDFSSYQNVKEYMDQYRALAQGRTGLANPEINVCETNTGNEGARPSFFQNVALWLSQNYGRRMLTFWSPGGTSSGPWDPSDGATIAALQSIEARYG